MYSVITVLRGGVRVQSGRFLEVYLCGIQMVGLFRPVNPKLTIVDLSCQQ